MNKRKVLIYIFFLKSGAGKSAVTYANALTRDGYEVTVVSGHSSPAMLSKLDDRIEVKLTHSPRSYRAIPHLRAALRECGPDVVLVIGGGNVYAYMASRLLSGFKGPLVVREAVSPRILIESENGYVAGLLKKFLLKTAYRRASRVIALTKAMREEMTDYWGVPHDHIAWIPNGVSVPSSSPKISKDSQIPTILSVGRLQPQKDHLTLLRAFSLVRAERPCRLLLAGDGKERGRLEGLARDLKIESDVVFLGYVDDVSDLYMEASLSVLSSRYEGFGHVLIESLAYGCPVVATDCPTGPAEVINTESIGLLAKVGDHYDLASKMLTALDTEYESSTLIARAEDFSIAKANERIIALFENAER